MTNDLDLDIGNLPLVLGPTGLLPQSPANLLNQLLTLVAKTNPGYTANLPGSLIEDISSTDIAALVLIDQLRVEMLNSLTPRGCNAFVLNQLGQIYGVRVGESVNTSVFVQFTGLPGYVIGKGFTVTDGNFQYSLSDGGVIGSDGVSLPLFAVATRPGIWAVPAGTVTGLITSVPEGFALSVVNSEPGLPGTDVETITSYRARVLMAGLAASQGMARYLRTLLSNVPGVQRRLIGIQQQLSGGWKIIVGGGDPYQVAYAIFTALFDVSTLVGSANHVVTFSQANPGLVTVDLNHLYSVGQHIGISGVTPSGYNSSTLAVIDTPSQKSFHVGTPYAANAIQSLTWVAVVAPTNGALTAVAGGALTAATYYVRSTWVNSLGETLGATETSLAVAANNVLRVASPSSVAPASAIGWNVYVSIATGTETKQNGTTPIALGTAWTEPTSGLVAGAALPAANTAGEATAVTLSNHGITPGSAFVLVGQQPAGWAGTFMAIAGTTATTLKWTLAVNPGTATVLGQLQAGIANFDTSALAVYGSGGVVTPNLRNNTVTLTDYPDTYQITYVIPPQQSISVLVQWHTTSPNYVSATAVAQLATPALQAYINQIVVGQPISIYTMTDVFMEAIQPVLPEALISLVQFTISINGVSTPITSGTGLVNGDPESYFYANLSDFSVQQI